MTIEIIKNKIYKLYKLNNKTNSISRQKIKYVKQNKAKNK